MKMNLKPNFEYICLFFNHSVITKRSTKDKKVKRGSGNSVTIRGNQKQNEALAIPEQKQPTADTAAARQFFTSIQHHFSVSLRRVKEVF